MKKVYVGGVVAIAPALVFAAHAQSPADKKDTPVAKEIGAKMPPAGGGFRMGLSHAAGGPRTPRPTQSTPQRSRSVNQADLPADRRWLRPARLVSQGTSPPAPRSWPMASKPHVIACTLCHLPNGNGHPESASVSGLPGEIHHRSDACLPRRRPGEYPRTRNGRDGLCHQRKGSERGGGIFRPNSHERSRNGCGWSRRVAGAGQPCRCGGARAFSTKARRRCRWRPT